MNGSDWPAAGHQSGETLGTYLHNLWLWLRGVRWLWTRQGIYGSSLTPTADIAQRQWPRLIFYKPGYGPWRFLAVYLTTYLAGTLAGYGVVSLSRAWYERSIICALCGNEFGHHGYTVRMHKWKPAHPFARFMTRLLDWIFAGSAHGRHTGPRLWGSENLRD